MAVSGDKSKHKLTPASAALAGKIGSSVLDNGTDLLKVFYEKSGESKKVAAIKEWEELRDKGTISEDDFQLKVKGLLGKKIEKESSQEIEKQENLEDSLKTKTLRQYKILLDKGTLTEEQFVHQKQVILTGKLPKSLEIHETKIEAVKLYEQLKDEEVLTEEEFEKVKDRVFGIAHHSENDKGFLGKVTSIFPKNRKN